ncbi:MAG: helix-turn-helix domain-containing protein [Deinococcales bacterium]
MADDVFCAQYQRAIELVGSRWTGVIIRALLGGIHHFSELKAAIPGLSDRMLAERLRELEAEGLTTRVVVPDMPVRVEYRLTDKGRALSAVIDAVVHWLESWGEGAPAPLVQRE